MDYLEYTKFLAGELEKKFAGKIDFILLFGSVARGKADEDSDVDLLVVGDKSIKNEVSRVRTETDLEYGMFTTIVFKTKEEFQKQRPYSDFLREVAETSVALYGEENIARA